MSSNSKNNKTKPEGDPSRHSKPHPPTASASMLDKGNISYGSVQNERYSLGSQPSSDHNNEDDLIVHPNMHGLWMSVCDGHDGLRTVQFVKKYLEQHVLGRPTWDDVTKSDNPEKIKVALTNYIRKTDENFFKSIDPFIEERRQLQSKIPKELNSYQAQQKFPAEVARLQDLESHISGGCTAVVAVLTSNMLYVANVGDSRAILAYEERDGSLQVKQLSEDHGVENEQEIQRLTALGLDREQLKKSGRLGTQENTRSIGDYILKGGYKDMDVLCHATKEPGTAEPHVISMNIDQHDHNTFKYIILMSDGVYKTLEAMDGGDTNKTGNELIVGIIEEYIAKNGWNNRVAIRVLQEIRQRQHDLYQICASEDVRSPMAVANRKRDDMTLVIYKFKFVTAV